MQAWCNQLVDLPRRESHLWITDMLGGKNVCPDNTLLSSVDSSFRRRCEMLRTGNLPNSWLKRVRFVINPRMNDKIRSNLFKKRNKILLDKSAYNEILELKPHEIQQIYGEDDFFELRDLFLEIGLSANFIHSIENDGGHHYFEKLQNVVEKFLVNKDFSHVPS